MTNWVRLIQIRNELPLKNDIPRAFLVITWTKSTTPSPIITWVGVASKASIYMGIISTIWLMLNLSVRVPRPCLYMLGSPSKNISIRVCKTILHPRILRFLLGEPSMYRHGIGTRTEWLSMSHMKDMMPIWCSPLKLHRLTWWSDLV